MGRSLDGLRPVIAACAGPPVRAGVRGLLLAFWGALTFIPPSVAAIQERAVGPPPPPKSLEFFNSTYVDHRSEAACAGARMVLQWHYTPKGLAVSALTFQGIAASATELTKINGWLAELEGDALARLECGNEGAVVSFVDAALAGTPAPTIKFSWIDNRATLLGRYRLR